MKITSTQIIGFIVAFLLGVGLTSFIMRDNSDVDSTKNEGAVESMDLASSDDESKTPEAMENEVKDEEPAVPAPATKNTATAPVATVAKTVTGSCNTGLSARKDSKLNGIVLNWSACASDDFQFYKLVKSSKNTSPSFPADPVAYSSSNKNAASFVDKTVAGRTTYYYRMCVVQRLGAVNCSNVASATF